MPEFCTYLWMLMVYNLRPVLCFAMDFKNNKRTKILAFQLHQGINWCRHIGFPYCAAFMLQKCLFIYCSLKCTAIQRTWLKLYISTMQNSDLSPFLWFAMHLRTISEHFCFLRRLKHEHYMHCEKIQYGGSNTLV